MLRKRLLCTGTMICGLLWASSAFSQVPTPANTWQDYDPGHGGGNDTVTITVTNNGDTLRVRFANVLFSLKTTVIMKAGNTGPGAALAGDFTAAGAHTLAFNITATNTPLLSNQSNTMLYLEGPNGRIWERAGIIDGANSFTLTNAAAGGWNCQTEAGTQQKWLADLANVQGLYIQVANNKAMPSGIPQTFTISNFRVLGTSVIGGSAVLTPFEQALMDAFGVTRIVDVTEEQKTWDTDGDGMTDYDEILSEFVPGYFDLLFRARIVSVTESGVDVKWACIAGKTYKLLKSNSLTPKNFTVVADGLQPALGSGAGSTVGYMTHTDSEQVDPNAFYVVEQNP